MKKIIFIVTVIFISFGCTHRILDFTIVSTKNIDLSKAATFKRGTTRMTGEDVAHIIIFIPTGAANIKEAADKAIEKVPGCIGLVDGVIYTKFFYIPYIYGKSSAIVEGTPLIDPSLAMNKENLFPDYSIMKLDKQGNIAEFRMVSEKEYNSLKSDIRKSYSK